MRFALLPSFVAAVMLFASGCYASHELATPGGDAGPPTCPPDAPRCIAPNAADPCGPPHDVTPVCHGDTWSCPTGAREYAVAPSSAESCLPFHDPSMGIRGLGGSIPRIPTTDGRCLWIGDSVTPASGDTVSNVAFDVDATAPFGTCPDAAPTLTGRLESAVVLEGVADPTPYLVQIDGGWLADGETRVAYRLFHFDAAGGFGVTEDGTGIGRWDATRERIVVGGPGTLRWTRDVDLGDAVLPAYGERSFTYLWGCPPPIHDLVEDCLVARVGGDLSTEYFTPLGWSGMPSPATSGSFAQGPWLGSVTTSVHGFSHVYAVGFGSTLEEDTATYPYGPWARAPTVARCDLPGDDEHAYCAGPVVHEELRDPTTSNDVPVTYGIGTTDDPGGRIDADPDAYWSRLTWARLP